MAFLHALLAGHARAQGPAAPPPSPYAPRSAPLFLTPPPTTYPSADGTIATSSRPLTAVGGSPRPAGSSRAPSAWASTRAAGDDSPAYQLTRYQPPGGPPATDEGRVAEYRIQVEPPGLERLARLDSDPTLFERIRQETRALYPNERVVFPDEPILSHDIYNGRGNIWPAQKIVAEPYFVVYKRLFFEQPMMERYGWDLGILSPVVSTGAFFADLVLFPYNVAAHPCQNYDGGAGHCLPGDAVPLLLYPPDLSVSGTLGEIATILALVAIFP